MFRISRPHRLLDTFRVSRPHRQLGVLEHAFDSLVFFRNCRENNSGMAAQLNQIQFLSVSSLAVE